MVDLKSREKHKRSSVLSLKKLLVIIFFSFLQILLTELNRIRYRRKEQKKKRHTLIDDSGRPYRRCEVVKDAAITLMKINRVIETGHAVRTHRNLYPICISVTRKAISNKTTMATTIGGRKEEESCVSRAGERRQWRIDSHVPLCKKKPGKDDLCCRNGCDLNCHLCMYSWRVGISRDCVRVSRKVHKGGTVSISAM